MDIKLKNEVFLKNNSNLNFLKGKKMQKKVFFKLLGIMVILLLVGYGCAKEEEIPTGEQIKSEEQVLEEPEVPAKAEEELKKELIEEVPAKIEEELKKEPQPLEAE